MRLSELVEELQELSAQELKRQSLRKREKSIAPEPKTPPPAVVKAGLQTSMMKRSPTLIKKGAACPPGTLRHTSGKCSRPEENPSDVAKLMGAHAHEKGTPEEHERTAKFQAHAAETLRSQGFEKEASRREADSAASQQTADLKRKNKARISGSAGKKAPTRPSIFDRAAALPSYKEDVTLPTLLAELSRAR
jgi:hypothetical protein